MCNSMQLYFANVKSLTKLAQAKFYNVVQQKAQSCQVQLVLLSSAASFNLHA